MNIKSEKDVDRALNILNYFKGRGEIESDEMILNILLILEDIKKQINEDKIFDENINVTENYLYNCLLRTADKYNVRNPFKEPQKFYEIYMMVKDLTILDEDWEAIIEKTRKQNRKQTMPNKLYHVFIDECKKDNVENILIAEGENFAPNLMNIVNKFENANITITCLESLYKNALCKLFEHRKNVEIIQTSIYDYGFVNKKYDLIFSLPIFGGRTLVEENKFICREFDAVALENLSYHLSDQGSLLIALPIRVTFARGKIEQLRNFIQSTYTIDEISELPERVFNFTGIKTCFLKLTNKKSYSSEIIIKKYANSLKENTREKFDISDETLVMIEELQEQNDWNLDIIFSQQDEEWLKYQRLDIRKEQLGNVAEVFRGKAITSKDDYGKIGVVNISNIGEYEINYDEMNHIDGDINRMYNYILQDGDILIPARGTVIKTAIFKKQPFECIAHSNVIVIRPNPGFINSTYLKVFLDSSFGKKLIQSTQQGMTVMNISYNDFKALEIPLPPMYEQNEIANEYNNEYEIYSETIKNANERWNESLNKLQKKYGGKH